MSVRNFPRLPEPWARLTLQSLLSAAVAENPKQIFLQDCPNREAWNGLEPRKLNYNTFAKNAKFLAAQLRTLGAKRGEAVLVMLPNIVELGLTIVACHLAGLTPAIAPIDESLDMLRAATERVQASMIVTTGWVGDIDLAEKARAVAAKASSVRCVSAFGFDLPDGVVMLEGWSEEDVRPIEQQRRVQEDCGLITFARDNGSVVAALRSEGQMIAEALAVSSVLPLDGKRGLINLLQPGSAAMVAASFTFPLFARSRVSLVGPFDANCVASVIKNEPHSFILAPNHFASWVKSDSFGNGILKDISGTLALVHANDLSVSVGEKGELGANLLLDLQEAGIMTADKWPEDGNIKLENSYYHPVQNILSPSQVMLDYCPAPWKDKIWAGFGAATLIKKDGVVPPLLADNSSLSWSFNLEERNFLREAVVAA